ncbi:MAG TPA: hypothetical protein VFY54_07740, partial [Rubrobacter sp.]|nr:hypothetical protein [Rubrobacter sp.]
MITQQSVLVQLIRLTERIPSLPPPPRRRGRPTLYSEKLFLKALVIMIVRRLHKVGELLAVLEEPTPEMTMVRELLCEKGRFPSRRTFERRMRALCPRACLSRSAAWDAISWGCSLRGSAPAERWPWTPP